MDVQASSHADDPYDRAFTDRIITNSFRISFIDEITSLKSQSHKSRGRCIHIHIYVCMYAPEKEDYV